MWIYFGKLNRKKKEIKIYFKSVIVKIIENLKNSYSNEEIAFNKEKLNNNAFMKKQNIFISLEKH